MSDQQVLGSPGIMERNDVACGVRFVSWVLSGKPAQRDVKSLWRGVFISEPYEDEHGDQIADVIIDGVEHHGFGLSILGITPSPTGERITNRRAVIDDSEWAR
jgi:hypothetical protein